jgi:N12 class adenine-specific DNA methylase
MAELYTMKRYLAPEALEAAGMAAFDAWAANFGETVTTLEVTFERPTLERYRPVEHVDTAAEALAVSLNEHGRLDWSRMEAVTGRAAAALQQELGPLVYENPESGRWETADAYLSGNVRHKLAVARAAAAIDKKYHRNIAPLEGAQPADLTPGEISARLGSTWIPTDDLGDFVADVIEASHTAVRVDYMPGDTITASKVPVAMRDIAFARLSP